MITASASHIPARRRETSFDLAGAELTATVEGVLLWREERLMVVADLHLEKGSAFAERRMLVPPYDTVATLRRLAASIAQHQPRRLIFLGDSFHDPRAGMRITETDRTALLDMLAGLDVIWIAGNHDPELPTGLPGTPAESLGYGPLTFRHEPQAGTASGEIAGHLHPAARIAARGRSIRRHCFIQNGERAILPAFGAYAGGLNVRNPAFAGLFQGRFNVHVLGDDAIFDFPDSHCL